MKNSSRRRIGKAVAQAAGLFFACALIVCSATPGHAQSVQLTWDANTETNVAGYRVYRSQQSGAYSAPLNPTLLSTPAFSDTAVQSGQTYYYVVTAVDTAGGQSPFSDQVQVNLPVIVTNKAPIVSAGADQTITLPATATLAASATDDGLPNGTLSYQWTVISGTGVTLSSPNSATSTVTFTAAGTYTFRVTVSDGQLFSSADVTVYANVYTLTLLVSKNGTVLKGSVTSISESSTDPRVTKLSLSIDNKTVATASGSSLVYKWDLRKVSGTHTVQGVSYNSSNSVLQSKAVTVTVN